MTQLFKNNQEIAENVMYFIMSLLPVYQKKLRENTIEIRKKKDGSYVTSVDYAIQFLIKSYLRQRGDFRPVIGEENLLELEKHCDSLIEEIREIIFDLDKNTFLRIMEPDPIIDKYDAFWTIDPIDGTFGFLKHKSFSVALALIENGYPTVGVLGCPSFKQDEKYIIYSASAQTQSLMYTLRQDGTCHKKTLSTEAGSDEFFYYCEPPMASLNQRHSETRRLLSKIHENLIPLRLDGQSKYALVAENMASVFIRLPAVSSPCKIWDHAAGSLILERSGGIITDSEGQKLNFQKPPNLLNKPIILGSLNSELHEKILNLLQN
ncbi:MAG: inositol monophosphatase family protein [Victivallaceae bacterium]